MFPVLAKLIGRKGGDPKPKVSCSGAKSAVVGQKNSDYKKLQLKTEGKEGGTQGKLRVPWGLFGDVHAILRWHVGGYIETKCAPCQGQAGELVLLGI